ncbi:MAG TPA: hypothetical protein VGF99_03470 [Myxococcota bacterium]
MLRTAAIASIVCVVVACAPSSSTVDVSTCIEDAECVDLCAGIADNLGAASTATRALTAAACEPTGIIITGPDGEDVAYDLPATCTCAVDGTDGSITVYDEVDLGCVYGGHAGHCLYQPSEFGGCTVGDTASCEAACELLETRIAADAQTAYVVDVVTDSCSPSGDCECSWRIDDLCFDESRQHKPCAD